MDGYVLIGERVPCAVARLWQNGYTVVLRDVTGKKQNACDTQLIVKIKFDAGGKKAEVFYSGFLLSAIGGE